jgi:hypothetical protein
MANTAPTSVTPRQALLLGTPLVVGVLALIRPGVSGPPGVFSQMRADTGLWLAISFLLLPLLGLLAIAGYTLMAGMAGRAALVSRWAFCAFGVFAVATTALLGIGTGVLAAYGQGRPSAAHPAVSATLDALWQSRLVLVIAFIAAAAWWLAVTTAVLALTRPAVSAQLVSLLVVLSGALFLNGQIEGTSTRLWWIGLLIVVALFAYAFEPRVLAALLAAAALLFSAGLGRPYGSLGMLCLLAALALREVPAVANLLAPSQTPSQSNRPRTARSTRAAR